MKLGFLFLLAALFTAGCSSTPTQVSSGAIQARTFSFPTRTGNPDMSIADNRESALRMIKTAITQNLAARGVSRVDSGGDVIVRFLIIKGDNVSTETIRNYFGYSDDTSVLHDKAHEAYMRSKNPNYFQAGTLIIDIVDGKNFKLLKRAYTTRPISADLSESARAARIQEAVDEILRDVQIKT